MSTIQETAQGLVDPDDASLGAGPYYGLYTYINTVEVVPDGLPIAQSGSQSRFIAYYQYDNTQPGLVGLKTLLPNRTTTTTVYNPVVYNPTFALRPGQSITYTISGSYISASLTSTLSKTERIEYEGITSLLLNNINYSTCKYIVTDPSKTNGETTTLWYWIGKDILLQSVIQAIDPATSNKVLVESKQLRRVTTDTNIIFPAPL
jgi:hypothetical protein